MLLENVYPAAALKRKIEESEKMIKEINEVPLHTLRMSPVHGRSVELHVKDEQVVFGIKQMLVLGLEAQIRLANKELEALL